VNQGRPAATPKSLKYLLVSTGRKESFRYFFFNLEVQVVQELQRCFFGVLD
jgi:hypothetical protein